MHYYQVEVKVRDRIVVVISEIVSRSGRHFFKPVSFGDIINKQYGGCGATSSSTCMSWNITGQPFIETACSRDKPPFSFVRGQDSTMWDIIWVSPQGHRSVSVSRHFLLQAPQCPCSVQKRFTRHHCCQGRSKSGCRIVGSHTRWSLLRVFGNVLYNLQLLVAFNCYSSVCCPFCKNDYHCMCHWCCWDCRGLCYSLGLKASPGLGWWRLHLMMLAEKAFFIVYMYCIRLFRFYTTYTCHAKHMML